MPKLTIFKDGYNVADPYYISLESALGRIRDGRSKKTCETIRSLVLQGTDEKKVAKLKMSLPSVLFHGVFSKEIEKEYKSGAKKGEKYISKREDESITEHSGLLVLDFDKCDLAAKTNQLKADPYIYAFWISPSGTGIKALVKCPAKLEQHYEYYEALLDRYPELDSTSKSISRLCFESYDPNLHVNGNAKIWDKTITEKKRQEVSVEQKSRRNYKAIDIAVRMVRASYDGNKHETLVKAGKLLGGHLDVSEDEAEAVLLPEVIIKGAIDVEGAKKAIRDGFGYGRAALITPIETHFKPIVLGPKDATPFIVSDDDMDEKIGKFYDGTMEFGRGIGFDGFDSFIRYRANAFYYMVGKKGGGKTTILLYLLLLDAVKNGSKYLICGIENSPHALRNQLVSFHLHDNAKYVYTNNRPQYEKSKEFISGHFTFLKYNDDWQLSHILDVAKSLHENTPFDGIMLDPYNAIRVPNAQNSFQYHVDCANLCRQFSDKYFSVYLTGHPTSSKQREGTAPKDVDGEGGGTFPNKAHVTFAIHRDVKAEGEARHTTDLSVDKVREKELYGGDETLDNFPIRLIFDWKKYGFKAWLPIPNGSGYSPPVNLLQNPLQVPQERINFVEHENEEIF